ncbi:HemK2/MTQ2 family protein methyltransferase [Nocardia caishijiensis]|uniref:Release factor glutamine methyltransferase n=1 Tax=Nocardia caishijiensis TaxID=184756 RepID=A0ABQ6YN34_9NOCA|nr:HemK2/MTQ2 family protein methyltransferase [Nocardia caishijiensis]KAF0846904.1 release factor glutamine methyltransferase [Nocardia caishijiensis]
MMILRAPGVYRPQADTWMLAEALRAVPRLRGGRVLELCAGTGAVTVAAAKAGAASVTAVDLSRRALASTWLNCRLRGVAVQLLHGDFSAAARLPRFDVVLANPPYVPAERAVGRGRALAWDAGPTGRSVLDRLCATLPDLLTDNGVGLIVHSAISDPDRSLDQLRSGGAEAQVVAVDTVPFGPVLRSRARRLAARGLIAKDQHNEKLVVIRVERNCCPAIGEPA